jgi:hypothetical protein
VVCQIAVNGNNPEHRLELVKRSCIYQALWQETTSIGSFFL